MPRYDRPGLHSENGSPIFVATPASAVASVVKMTPIDRLKDLVFICNGIFSELVERDSSENCLNDIINEEKRCTKSTNPNKLAIKIIDMTVAVPHFGVLTVGADFIGGGKSSPPTVLYGKHSQTLEKLLFPICCIEVSSVKEVEKFAARKLLWASIMWLLTNDDKPMSVDIVHKEKTNQLNDLVKELLPVTNIIAGCDIGSLREVLAYLKSYSLSMPGAKPNKDLALAEINERNGQLLKVEDIPQPLHAALVTKISGMTLDDIKASGKSISFS